MNYIILICSTTCHLYIFTPPYRMYRCAHQIAIELALTRGLIHGIDSLVAARQRYQNGGVVGALKGMISIERSRQSSIGVLGGKHQEGDGIDDLDVLEIVILSNYG